jgi:hypothetical protein
MLLVPAILAGAAGSAQARGGVVTISAHRVGRPIARGFAGVSLEYKSVAGYEGSAHSGANQVLAQLIKNLAPGQTPILRIGGDSTDWTWWPIRGVHVPPGVNYRLSPRWLAKARNLVRTTGARVIFGINLEDDNPRLASVEAHKLVGGVGKQHVRALELGNEPMLYPKLPWYHTRSGRKVFGRPAGYDMADYLGEFNRFTHVMPQVPLAGPAIGHSWLSEMTSFINGARRLSLVTLHAYAINRFGDAFRGRNCSTAMGDASHPTINTLLAPFASGGLMRTSGAALSDTHRRGLYFRVDEMNAITCAGTPGVSNTFASALWVLNAMFSMARHGVDGVNLHTWQGSWGQLFQMHRSHGRWSATVRPEYYGLLLFARAAPPGSRFLSEHQRSVGPIESWATISGHRIRLVLINHSLSQGRNLTVRPPEPRGEALLERLHAPRASSKFRITLGGLGFGRRTATGITSGRTSTRSLKNRSGAYHLRVPAASAAVVTITTAR